MNDSRNVQSKKGLRISWRGATLIVVFFILALFAVQNFQIVQVNLFGVKLDMPVWLLVSVVFVLGVFLGGAVRGATRKLRKPKTPHS
jgi:uncharacterized integral membrane protein